MASKDDLVIKIKGSDWRIRRLTAAKFIKENGECGAITKPQFKLIEFRKDELYSSHCRHEIFHAYIAECNTESTELSAGQMEELAASIVGEFSIEIVAQADKVLTYLLEK